MKKLTTLKLAVATVSVAGLLASGGAAAHHSAIQFDFTKQVAYTGTVKEFAAINPHMRLVIEVQQPDGKHEVRFEGHSTNNMYRNGYRKGMVNVGDTLTVRCAPFKNGDLGGYVVSATTKGGESFGMQSRNLAPEDLKKQAEGK